MNFQNTPAQLLATALLALACASCSVISLPLMPSAASGSSANQTDTQTAVHEAASPAASPAAVAAVIAERFEIAQRQFERVLQSVRAAQYADELLSMSVDGDSAVKDFTQTLFLLGLADCRRQLAIAKPVQWMQRFKQEGKAQLVASLEQQIAGLPALSQRCQAATQSYFFDTNTGAPAGDKAIWMLQWVAMFGPTSGGMKLSNYPRPPLHLRGQFEAARFDNDTLRLQVRTPIGIDEYILNGVALDNVAARAGMTDKIRSLCSGAAVDAMRDSDDRDRTAAGTRNIAASTNELRSFSMTMNASCGHVADLGLALLERGWVQASHKEALAQSPYYQAQVKARAAKLGIWALQP